MTLTSRGCGLLVTGTVLLPTGLLLGYAEATLLGSICVLVVLSATAYSAWQPRLEVGRVVTPDRIIQGETSQVTLSVQGHNRWWTRTIRAHDRCAGTDLPITVTRVPPRGSATPSTTRYPVPVTRRGVVPVGPLQVHRYDPFGLVSSTRTHGPTATVWVYPRIHPLNVLPAGATRSLDGHIDRVPHGSITFAALREYVIGDELRHVHWRTSARVGQLMVREHVDTSVPRLVVLLDTRASAWMSTVDDDDTPEHTGTAAGGIESEAFESGCEAAASIIAAAIREGLSVALVFSTAGHAGAGTPATSLDTPTGAPTTNSRAMLDRLAEVKPTTTNTSTIDDVMTTLRRHRSGDTLIYLTGQRGAADMGSVVALRGSYPVVVIGILGPDGSTPSTPDSVVTLVAADGAEFAQVWNGTRPW